MISRRKIVTSGALIIAAELAPAYAQQKRLEENDEGWYTTGKREDIARSLVTFFDQATGYFPVAGFTYDGSGNYSILEQFLFGFNGAPRDLERLPHDRWLVSGTVPKQPSMVAFVVLAADQSRIDAAMMSYMICPPGGVDSKDLDGTSHKVGCEIDPGWAIFISRYENRDEELITGLKKVASKYAGYRQRPFVQAGVRDKLSVQAKAVVVKVP